VRSKENKQKWKKKIVDNALRKVSEFITLEEEPSIPR
jgi:hypothetical protein